MTNAYTRAYTEVLEILSHFSKEEYAKIPTKKIEFYRSNMDKKYNYKINPEVNLAEQEISKEANAILITLFRDYFASEKQKIALKKLLNQNQLKEEQEKIMVKRYGKPEEVAYLVKFLISDEADFINKMKAKLFEKGCSGNCYYETYGMKK